MSCTGVIHRAIHSGYTAHWANRTIRTVWTVATSSRSQTSSTLGFNPSLCHNCIQLWQLCCRTTDAEMVLYFCPRIDLIHHIIQSKDKDCAGFDLPGCVMIWLNYMIILCTNLFMCHSPRSRSDLCTCKSECSPPRFSSWRSKSKQYNWLLGVNPAPRCNAARHQSISTSASGWAEGLEISTCIEPLSITSESWPMFDGILHQAYFPIHDEAGIAKIKEFQVASSEPY